MSRSEDGVTGVYCSRRGGRKAAACPFKTLGVTEKSSDAEIKNAYRAAALKWHPDKRPSNRGEAEIKFKEISSAYQKIKDKTSRLTYARDKRMKASPAATPGSYASGTGGAITEMRVPLKGGVAKGRFLVSHLSR